jgi:hypothetical protein
MKPIRFGGISMKLEQGSTSAVVAFRCPAQLRADAEAMASAEGVSIADVARRSLMRDIRRWRAQREINADTASA